MLTLLGHRSKVRALAFSPDGRRLATIAGREKRISLWDVSTRDRTLSFGEASEVQALTFSPDGRDVIFASDRYLYRWEFDRNLVQSKWLRVANYCHRLAYSPDGSVLAAACFARYGAGDCFRVDLFRVSEMPKKTFLVGGYGAPYFLAFSPDGRCLAAGGEDERVRVWDMAGEAKAVTWKCGGPVHAVAFAPGRPVAAVAAGDGLALYDTATRKPRGELAGHAGPVRAVAFSPDGRLLLSAGDDGTARLWDTASWREQRVFDWGVGPVTVAAFSPDGMVAAAGGETGLVLWDVE